MIKANARKYSISALCRCLGIARSTYYYECHDPRDESSLEEAIQAAYDENRRVYGQRKLKRVLFRKGWTVSRRRIGRIMAKRGLVSAYNQLNIVGKIFQSICTGLQDKTNMQDAFASLYNGSLFNHYCLCIALFSEPDIINSTRNLPSDIFSIISLKVQENEYNITFSPIGLNQYLFFFPGIRDECRLFALSLIKEIESSRLGELIVGISNTHTNLEYLTDAYRESFLALQQKYLGLSGNIFIYEDKVLNLIYRQNTIYSIYVPKLYYYQQKLALCLLNYNARSNLSQTINYLFADIEYLNMQLEDARRFCEELLLLISSNLIKEAGHDGLNMEISDHLTMFG